MATVSSLSSQIDSLVQQYQTSLQSRSVEPLKTKRMTVNTRLTVISNLATKLKTLSAAADKLTVTGSTSKFEQYSVASSSESIISGTAASTALSGSHSLLVTQLAKKDVVISNQLTSGGTSVSAAEGAGTKTIRFSVGGVLTNINVSILGTESNASILSKIATAINSSTVSGSSNGGDFIVGDSSSNVGTITAINMTSVAQGTTFTLSKTNTDKLTLTSSSGASQEVTIAAATVGGEQIINFGDLGVSFTLMGNFDSPSAADTIDALLTMGTTISKASPVTAAVVGDTPLTSKLVLTSKETGSSKAIVFSDVTGTLLANVGLTAGVSSGRTAVTSIGAGYTYASTSTLNSKFTLDGIDITRESNSFSDVLTGVTLNLKSTQLLTDTPVQLTVGVDTSAVRSEVQSFLDSYNGALLYLRNQTLTDSTTYARQTLSGDSTFISLKMNLQSVLGQRVSSAAPGNPNVLYGIGITAGVDGTLSISDSEKFDDAMAVSSTKVADLFNSSNGVAVKLKNLLSGYVAAKGQMDAAHSTLSSQITNLDNRIKTAQERITAQVKRYRDEFTKLQNAVNMANQQLQQIQTILTAVGG